MKIIAGNTQQADLMCQIQRGLGQCQTFWMSTEAEHLWHWQGLEGSITQPLSLMMGSLTHLAQTCLVNVELARSRAKKRLRVSTLLCFAMQSFHVSFCALPD